MQGSHFFFVQPMLSNNPIICHWWCLLEWTSYLLQCWLWSQTVSKITEHSHSPGVKVKLREVDYIFWPLSFSKFLSPEINRHLYPRHFLYSLDKAVFSLYPSQHRCWFFFLIVLHKLSKDMLLFVNAWFVSFLHSLRFPINPCCPKTNILPFLKILFFS